MLQILVITPKKKHVAFSVEPGYPVWKLKWKIHDHWGIPPLWQSLYYESEGRDPVLQDDNYHLGQDSMHDLVLHLEIKPPPSARAPFLADNHHNDI